LEFFLRVAQPFFAASDLDNIFFFAVVRFAEVFFVVVFLVAFFAVAILKKKTTLYLIRV
jgi:hypothetical protein